jgi:hypothetical protein
METTLSGSMETHQEVFEWWRNKKGEIVNSIEDLQASGTTDPVVLDLMKDLVQGAKLRKKTMEEYFGED